MTSSDGDPFSSFLLRRSRFHFTRVPPANWHLARDTPSNLPLILCQCLSDATCIQFKEQGLTGLLIIVKGESYES